MHGVHHKNPEAELRLGCGPILERHGPHQDEGAFGNLVKYVGAVTYQVAFGKLDRKYKQIYKRYIYV